MASPVATGGDVHIVQPGQTLYSIALWYGVDMWTLARANNLVNPNHIYVGQRLVIPSTAPSPSQPTPGAYVVRYGDTLYSIARYYGTTAWAIAQANGIYNMNHIYVGQHLVIPGSGTAPAPSPTPTPAPAPGTPAPPSTPAPTPAPSGWQGAYYKGTEITGSPLFVRNDQAVNFYWGKRAPDTRLDTDNFAVQWTRTINFRGGVYQMKLTADDGARLWIDGENVLDAWDAQPAGHHEIDVTLEPGHHLVTIDYREQSGDATIAFTFKRLGDAPAEPAPTTTPDPGEAPAAPATAWLGEYFGNETLSGDPVITQMDDHIGFEWGLDAPVSGIPDNYFSVRWTRQATFYGDNYAFCAMADDGVRLYVDDTLVIDEWHGSNGLSYCAEVDLHEGDHTVKVEYYEDGGEALIYVWWERH